jgi:fructose-bisphosphate aldolase class II
MLGGVEEDIVGSVCLTDPAEAEEFVKRTGCDCLAVAIGTSHGAYKFKAEPGKKMGLHFEVIEAIQKLLPGYPMVMHGSSSVPKSEVDRINAAGGHMPDTSGVPEEDFLPAAKMGVCKVNIDTDGRLVWTRVHREFFRDFPEKFDLRDPGKIYIEEYAKMIAHKNQVLGSAGMLDEIRAKLNKK